MAKMKIELNRKGVSELMRSSEMQSILREQAEAIQGRCGDGYSTTTKTGKNRAYANVFPETWRAKNSNKKHNTLLKAVRG